VKDEDGDDRAGIAAAPSGGHARRRLAATAGLAVVLVGTYLGWRATTLAGLPDVADPFDRATSGTIDIPDDQNAFTFYRLATDAFPGFESDLPATPVFTEWSEVTPAHLATLEAKRRSLELWYEGTKRDRAVYIQPRDATFMLVLPVTQRLRSFAKLANLEAFRRQHEGDLVGAWTWLRANLRASRHSGTNGFFMERIVGVVNFEQASRQAKVWADDPKVGVELLRKALDDVLAVDALTPDVSESVRHEYFSAMISLDDPVLRRLSLYDGATTTLPASLSARLKHRADDAVDFLMHEPERSRRLINWAVANWLAVGNLPAPERASRVVKLGKRSFYGTAAGTPNALGPEALARWVDSARYARPYQSIWSAIEPTLTRDDRNRAGLIVHLAEQLHLRDRGALPATPEALVGPYLKAIPVGYDPPSGSREAPGPPR